MLIMAPWLCLENMKISESFKLSSGIYNTNWIWFYCPHKKTTMLTKNISRLGHIWTLEPSIMEQPLKCVLTIQRWGQHRISANIRTPAHQYHIFWKLYDIGTQFKFYIKYVTIACLNYPKHGGVAYELWQLTWFLNSLYFDSYFFSLS